jgi:hypothetical protein
MLSFLATIPFESNWRRRGNTAQLGGTFVVHSCGLSLHVGARADVRALIGEYA